MDSFSNNFTSSTSIKPSSVTKPSFNDGNNENELNPEMASKLNRHQSPNKNFMSPTICTANKVTVPKKKVLAERNETLDVVEQQNLRRSSGFSSKAVKSPIVDDNAQKPYDPITNYLSPRPKFLRYNPNRRRKILLQEDEDSVRNSSSFDAELELGGDSYGFVDSCSQKESVDEVDDEINKEGECEEDEESEAEDEEEEEIVEFGEDKGYLMGFLKFLVVVIAVILTTQAICSMNTPTSSHTVETWSNVYGVAGLNFSQVESCPIMEVDLMVGRSKEVELVETIDEGQDVVETMDGVYEDEEVTTEEEEIIQDEMLTEQVETSQLVNVEILEDSEIASSEVVEIQVDAESESEETDPQSVYDEEFEIAEDMEDVVEEDIDDLEITNTSSIRSESFDLILPVLIGFITLILTSLGIVYHSKRMKSSTPVAPTIAAPGANREAENEQIKVSELSSNPSSFIQQREEEEEERLVNFTSSLKYDTSEEISRIHAPSVELLGEFVFGEEGDASNSLIQSTTVSPGEIRSSRMESSTGDSVAYTEKTTVKKQRRRNAEATAVITPSPVRRSSRLQNRSIKSP